jgi:hypothetical protein
MLVSRKEQKLLAECTSGNYPWMMLTTLYKSFTFMLSNKVSMCSSTYHVIMIIACHRIQCTVCIFTYTIASYKIAEGSTGSSANEADRDRPTGNLDTGDARERRARRGSVRVRGSST